MWTRPIATVLVPCKLIPFGGLASIVVLRSGPNACSYRSRPIARRGISSSLSVFVIRWSRHRGCRDGRLCGSVPTPTEFVRECCRVQGGLTARSFGLPPQAVSPRYWSTGHRPRPSENAGYSARVCLGLKASARPILAPLVLRRQHGPLRLLISSRAPRPTAPAAPHVP